MAGGTAGKTAAAEVKSEPVARDNQVLERRDETKGEENL